MPELQVRIEEALDHMGREGLTPLQASALERPVRLPVEVEPRVLAAALTTTTGAPPENAVQVGRHRALDYPTGIVDLLDPVPVRVRGSVVPYLREGADDRSAATAPGPLGPRTENTAAREATLTWTEQREALASVSTTVPVSEETLVDAPNVVQLFRRRLMRDGRRQIENILGTRFRAMAQAVPDVYAPAGPLTPADVPRSGMQAVDIDTGDHDTTVKRVFVVMNAVFEAIERIRTVGESAATGVVLSRDAMRIMQRYRTHDDAWSFSGAAAGRLDGNPWGLRTATSDALAGDGVDDGPPFYSRVSGYSWAEGQLLGIVGDFGAADLATDGRLAYELGHSGNDWTNLRRTARMDARFGLLTYRPRAFCVLRLAARGI